MKKIIKLLLLFIISTTIVNAQCVFNKGEKFKYSVKLNFIKAGKSYIKINEITEVDGHQVYHIISKTRTTGFLDRLFHIREHMESWTDCDSLFTRKFYKDVDEVNYEKTFEAKFNYQDSVVVLKNGKKKPISGPIMDWLSMIFYFRTIELKKGQEIALTFFDNNKLKNYSALVLGKKKVEIDNDVYNCWVIEPGEISKKNIKKKHDIKIYLSENDPKIPVKIITKAKFGTMILELE